jgi:hypothetical protein
LYVEIRGGGGHAGRVGPVDPGQRTSPYREHDSPQGTVEFRDDIYGRDKALVAMLALPEDGRPPERTVAGLACPGMSRGLASLNP